MPTANANSRNPFSSASECSINHSVTSFRLIRFVIQREGKLDGSARELVWCGPQTAAVRLDDRPADRQSHTHALRFGCIERAENLFEILPVNSHSAILNRDQHLIGFVRTRADDQLARAITHPS